MTQVLAARETGMLALCVMCLGAAGAAAKPPELQFPVDCEIGKTCYVQQYVDHDAGTGIRDYRCGALSNNGHTGTDIRLPGIAAMTRGVSVIAAAPGVVKATREGMPDVDYRLVGREAVTDRGLGNVVVIQHADGWQTSYAHLRRGSVAVAPGDTVKAGATLGLIGLSGLTNFPHVHFGVRHRGKVVDPFVGTRPRVGCGPPETALWHPKILRQLTYKSTFAMRSGFFHRPMTMAALQFDLYDRNTLSRRHGRLFFGILVAGLYKGDTYRFRLVDAAGKTLRDLNGVEQRRRSAQFYKAELKRIQQLPAGAYTARFTLSGIRNGKRGIVLDERRALTLR